MTELTTIHRTESNNRLHGGVQHVYKFPNGYGASVVRHSFSYGRESGLWELAVLDGDDLTYTTPITSDVLGHLSDDDVNATLDQIAALPATDKAVTS